MLSLLSLAYTLNRTTKFGDFEFKSVSYLDGPIEAMMQILTTNFDNLDNFHISDSY